MSSDVDVQPQILHTEGCPLPQELVDIIIDHLHDNVVALRNCSLVCRSWVPPSRRHLFRLIIFKFPRLRHHSNKIIYAYRKYARLNQCLRDSSDIAGYVREVVLSVDYAYNWNHVATMKDPTVCLVLEQLTSLTRLELKLDGWHNLMANVQTTIYSVIRSCPLTHLAIRRGYHSTVEHLTSVLSCCPSTLEDLRLTSPAGWPPMVKPVGGDILPCSTPRPKLHSLTLDLSAMPFISGWLESPQATVDTTSLRNLSVCVGPEFLATARLIRAADSSLECLELKELSLSTDLATFVIDLSLVPYLRHLRIGYHAISTSASFAGWILSLFSNVKSSLCLEEIEITVNIRTPTMLSLNDFGWSRWRSVDRLFTRIEFSGLRKVSVSLNVTTSDFDSTATGCTPKLISDQFPTLHARGIFFTFESLNFTHDLSAT